MSRRARALLAATAVTVVAVVAGWLVWRSLDRPGAEATAPSPTATSTTTPRPVEAATTLRTRPTCASVDHPFDPRSVTVPGVVTRAGLITPPRDANGVPGVPPLTSEGKHVFARDLAQGVRPGDPRGNVLLNAHTWPDGSALGNQLLAGLGVGDRIVVDGAGSRLCYRVTDEVEVPATRGFPRYYARKGPPQLAIIVCSGRRLGPGEWEKRTIWFASPHA